MFDYPKHFGDQPPKLLFDDWTIVLDQETRRKLIEHCLAFGWLPFIDWSEEHNYYIWHTIISFEQRLKWVKSIAAQFESSKPTRRSQEAQIIDALVQMFEGAGIEVERQVPCVIGIADLVTTTRDTVCEIKARLTRALLFQAIGQVLLYRQCINPQAKAVIVGYPSLDAEKIRPYVEALGIELVFWS